MVNTSLMFEHLNNIIDNKLPETGLDFYSVIVGTKPSKGARSPKLWNKVYTYEGKNVLMVPVDVKEENLETLFNYLKQDKHCLGGAVAVPYKEKIFNLIKNNVREEIRAIGAINCFYRLTSGHLANDFTGTNTDGEACLEPVRKQLTETNNLNIGLMGYGGAGKAILNFLLKDFDDKHKIYVFNRNPIKIKDVGRGKLFTCALDDLATYIPHLDLLINATSVGHIDNIHSTPVPTQVLEQAKKTMIVYDIIYDPKRTKLLKDSEEKGLKTINGLRMNLIQAVLAYSYTNPTALEKEEIFNIMN